MAIDAFAIFDLSPMGAQLLSYDGVRVSYNGEVYNFCYLRVELETNGHRFRGHSDTEVILHAHAEWGVERLMRLEGDLCPRRVGFGGSL